MKSRSTLRITSLLLACVLAPIALAAVAYTVNQRRESTRDTSANAAQAGPAGPSAHLGHDHGESGAHAEDADHADHAKTGQTVLKDEHGHAVDLHEHGAEEGHVDEVTLDPEAIRKSGIRVESARRRPLDETYAIPARIAYNTEKMAHVGTPVEGRVSEIRVRLGEVVKQGATLLVVDSPALGEAQSEFLQRRMQTQVAQSALDVARTAAERAGRLLEGKGISLGEYQRREGEFKAAQGALLTAEASVSAARNKLRLWGMREADIARLVKTNEIDPRFAVHAPIAGSVIEREATLGEVVGPDRESLLVLADLRTLWVLADVPENKVRHIAVGTSASVSVEALGTRPLIGRVAYIAPELNRETRTAQVRVEVEDGRSPLKPGMFAQVHLALSPAPAKGAAHPLLVPEISVQNFEGGQAVFVEVAGEPGTFSARPVKVGASNGRMVAVLEGLDEMARVVTDGSFVIKAELGKGIMEGKTCSGH